MSPVIDWRPVRLAVFDVDGTLYDQRALRLGMAFRLVRHCLARRSWRTARILKAYRSMREDAASPSARFSESDLLDGVAARLGLPGPEVRAVVSEWIHDRPLALLPKLRYPGVQDLFRLLKASGRSVAILSDHPARDKIEALGLAADEILAADDADLGSLKPSPKGLQVLMRRVGVSPAATVMIGDRPERDGEAGRAAGVATLIRSKRARPGWTCFASFADLAPGLADASPEVADAVR